MHNNPKTESDGAWKEILDLYFEDFIKFFFPEAYEQISWEQGFQFLDKEMHKILRNAKVGSRVADKLVRVQIKQNGDDWVLIHIEVHGKEEATFAEDMYTYHYKIYDRYKMKVASLAILTDGNPKWRPSEFNAELFNCWSSLKFPMVKLSDYRDRRETLENDKNPFTIVVLTHLAAQEARGDLDVMLMSKRNLVRRLYENGYDKATVINLFRFIDFVLTLPEDLDLQIWQDIQHYEGGADMQYITSVERIGMKKGIEQGVKLGLEKGFKQGLEAGVKQGREEGLKFALELKFGNKGLEFLPIIANLKSPRDLTTFKNRLKKAQTAAELKKFYK